MQTSAAELRGIIRGLETDIRSSWLRCLESYGLAPSRIALPPVVTKGELRDQKDPIDDLLALAAPEIKRLFARLVDSDYLITIASKEGINVASRCDYQLISRMEGKGLLPGAVWSEEMQGTNGVGTCVKLGKPLSVLKTDHFSESLKSLSCSVVPIYGPGHDLRCVLNITTDRPTDRVSERILLSVLEQSARRIENTYFGHHHRDVRIVKVSTENDFADPGNEVRFAIDGSDTVIDATSTSQEVIGMPRDKFIGRPISDMLSIDVDRSSDDLVRWIPSDRPGRDGVFVMVNEPPRSKSPHSGRSLNHRRAAAASSVPAFRDSAFALNPELVVAFSKALRVLTAGLPILFRGEPGCGRQALAEILGRESSLEFRRISCALEPADRIGAILGDSDLRGLIYLEDVDRLPSQLAMAISRTVDPCRPQGPHFVGSCDHAATAPAAFRQTMIIDLPPLRHYPNRLTLVDKIIEEEILFSRREVSVSIQVSDLLRGLTWPGNIQELRMTVRHMLALCEGDTLLPEHLPAFLQMESVSHGCCSRRDLAERQGMIAALELLNWNVSRTAEYLAVSRATLNRKIRQFDLVRPRGRRGR